MDFKWFVIGFFACPLSTSVLFGTWVMYCTWRNDRATKRANQAQVEQRVSEQVTYTSGAAYDACLDDGPTTDYDTEAVRKLLNSW